MGKVWRAPGSWSPLCRDPVPPTGSFRVPTPASKAESLPGCQDPSSKTLEGAWEDQVAQKNSYWAAQGQNPGFASCCLCPSLSPRAGGSSKAGAGAPQGPLCLPGVQVSAASVWATELTLRSTACSPAQPWGPFTASH